jgi:two-component sensor histidine kinase
VFNRFSTGAWVGGDPDAPANSPGGVGACDECVIVQEADHRIANQLAILAAFVRLKALDLAHQTAEPAREDVQSLLMNVRLQIEAMARLQRSFAVGGAGRSTDLGKHLHLVCGALVPALSGSVELIEDYEADCRAGPGQVLPLTQIIAEVITNAVKYACPQGGSGRILVRARRVGAEAIMIEVIDDGPGLPVGVNLVSGGGLGFRLIRALSIQLGALVEFASGKIGLRFRITLPSDPRADGCREQSN